MAKKSLVVYYTVTGNTEIVAKAIADALGADLLRVEDQVKRKGFVGFMRTGFQSLRKKSVPIKDGGVDVSKYDLVLIGSPTYAGNIAPGLRTFIRSNNENFKTVAYFGTGGDKKNDGVLRKLQAETELESKGGLYLSDKAVKNGEYEALVKDFVAAL